MNLDKTNRSIQVFGGDAHNVPFWFLVMLRGSQIRAIQNGRDRERPNLPWHDFIANHDPSLDLLAETIAFWPTFEALSGIRHHLRAIGAHGVANKLTILTLNDYDRIRDNTNEKGGEMVSLEDLQQEIATNTEISTPAGDKWPRASVPRFKKGSLKRRRIRDDIDDLSSNYTYETDDRDMPHRKARRITRTGDAWESDKETDLGVHTVLKIRVTAALPLTTADDELAM
ncbi:hypothetical protein HDU87_008653 [Geranomyces variabilis]|uniref:Uncharacterized protein n=1 Tax=Geranomyces variabilis TaxID=109894 RepID=A0AAD5TCN7_9FUNG|nr:hypothetical protein HDU87_008653 [Geranomyces variabilis]